MSTEMLHAIRDNIPNFVEYNYPLFADFIEHYYEFLISDSDLKKLIEFHNYILANDDKLDNYIDLLKEEVGLDIPIHEAFADNKKLVIHYLNFILKKRGNESAIKALMKLSFNEDVIVEYPYKLLFIPSNTKHNVLKTCLLKSEVKPDKNYYSLKSYSSDLEGDIESISIFEKNGFYYSFIEFYSTKDLKVNERIDLIGNDTIICNNEGVYEISIDNKGQYFKIGEIISFTDSIVQGEYIIVDITKGYIDSLSITSAGTGYKAGDVILSKPNKGFFAKVTTVGSNGEITAVELLNTGEEFEEMPEFYILSEGTGAKISGTSKNIGGIKKVKILQPTLLKQSDQYTLYTNKGINATLTLGLVGSSNSTAFLNNNHKTAINNFILDSKDIHEHSYNIITELDFKFWKKYLDKYLHRSGFVYKHIYPVEVQKELNINYESKVI